MAGGPGDGLAGGRHKGWGYPLSEPTKLGTWGRSGVEVIGRVLGGEIRVAVILVASGLTRCWRG